MTAAQVETEAVVNISMTDFELEICEILEEAGNNFIGIGQFMSG